MKLITCLYQIVNVKLHFCPTVWTHWPPLKNCIWLRHVCRFKCQCLLVVNYKQNLDCLYIKNNLMFKVLSWTVYMCIMHWYGIWAKQQAVEAFVEHYRKLYWTNNWTIGILIGWSCRFKSYVVQLYFVYLEIVYIRSLIDMNITLSSDLLTNSVIAFNVK